MKTRILLLWTWAALLAACSGNPAVESTSTSLMAADSDSDAVTLGAAVDEQASTDTYQELERPEAKPEKVQAQLRREWEAAEEAEKRFLGTPRLVGWVGELKETQDEDGMPLYGKLPDARFGSLTVKEHLYYSLFHPENWDQICAEFLFDAGLVKAISGSLPYGNGDYPSDRQQKALEARLDSVGTYVVECLQANQGLSPTLMHLVVDYKIREAIPVLMDIYKSQPLKDDLILTTMIELMRNAEYPGWMESDLNKELGGSMRDYVALTPTNADKIMFYAKKFAAS